jgi:hypothetical protein
MPSGQSLFAFVWDVLSMFWSLMEEAAGHVCMGIVDAIFVGLFLVGIVITTKYTPLKESKCHEAEMWQVTIYNTSYYAVLASIKPGNDASYYCWQAFSVLVILILVT